MGTVRPKSKQGNTTHLNISFSMENEKELLGWDSNTRHIIMYLIIFACAIIYAAFCNDFISGAYKIRSFLLTLQYFLLQVMVSHIS